MVDSTPAAGAVRSPAARIAYSYAPASRCASAAWPRTPSMLAVEENPSRKKEVYGKSPRSLPTRGGRPGMPTPRHLESTVGNIIFGGNWADAADHTRGTENGVGGARLHEVRAAPAPRPDFFFLSVRTRAPQVGHAQTPVGKSLHCEGPVRQAEAVEMHVFGEQPPTRPTVGSRAHLSRAHVYHMASTSDQVIWNKDVPC